MRLATFLIVAVIVHGSLWPYDFRIPPGPGGPLDALLHSWPGHPSRTDIIANVLLYIPLGLFAASAGRGPAVVRFCLVTLAGALLSVTMELIQFYDPGRFTSLSDVITNTTGTALGAAAALMLGRSRLPGLQRIAAEPVPALLLAAMLGYRLAPWVPSANLHKYWTAIQPLLSGPLPPPDQVFRYFALWLTASELLAALSSPHAAVFLAPMLVLFVLIGKVLVVGSVLTRPELAGAALAVGVAWPILASLRRHTPIVAAVLLASVVLQRLAPFTFLPEPRPFGWLPFRAFLSGSALVNIASMLEKLFLYGSLLWLLARAGMRQWAAAALVAAILFATSFAERWLPGRSAEITDMVMVLITAVLLRALEAWRPLKPARGAAAAPARPR